jgi:hypothetical protein
LGATEASERAADLSAAGGGELPPRADARFKTMCERGVSSLDMAPFGRLRLTPEGSLAMEEVGDGCSDES